jgi:hypothetical protein
MAKELTTKSTQNPFLREYSRGLKALDPARVSSETSPEKFVRLGVTCIPKMFDCNTLSVEAAWDLILATDMVCGTLTPRRLTRVFPVEKRYDGHKKGEKDYFSTMKRLREFGMDTLIGEQVDSLLFDYMNPHVEIYNAVKISVASKIRVSQGYPPIYEELMAKIGIRLVPFDTDHSPVDTWGSPSATVSEKFSFRWTEGSHGI